MPAIFYTIVCKSDLSTSVLFIEKREPIRTHDRDNKGESSDIPKK